MLTAVRIALLVVGLTLLAQASPQLSAPQQAAVDKLTAKGGLVLQVAADSDGLAINLSLAGKGATDDLIGEIKGLPKVTSINLGGTAVTDAGLAHLAGLADLTTLHLERTAISDAGLASLKSLEKLEYLNLYGTGITDAGLAQLAGVKSLKRLFLWQTKVTDAGVAEFKKAVPGATINRGEELALIATIKPYTGPQPINTVCPILNKPINPQFTYTHEGKLIGFCCAKCCGQFAKEPGKYALKVKADAQPAEPRPTNAKPEDKKPAKVAVNSKCPVSGAAVDTAVTFDHEGKTYAFCCKNCCARFAREPAKYVADVK